MALLAASDTVEYGIAHAKLLALIIFLAIAAEVALIDLTGALPPSQVLQIKPMRS